MEWGFTRERIRNISEQDDRLKVTDLVVKANWVLRNWMQSQLKRMEINDLENKEMERINEWKDKEVENYRVAKNIYKAL